MIDRGVRICDCCRKEADELFAYDGEAYCLECIKDDTKIVCESCENEQATYYYEGEHLCEICLIDRLEHYDGKVRTEEDAETEYYDQLDHDRRNEP